VSAPAGPPAPPVAGGWRRIPLWLRLVTTLLALAFAGLTIAGAFGLRLLRDDLVARADAQLDEATNAATTSQAELAAGIEADEKGVLPSDFYFRVVDLSGLRTIAEHAAPLSPDESPPTLPRLDGEEAADRTGEPFTVGSVDGHDRWRVLVTPVRMRATGERGTLLVATSLRETDDTVKNLLRIDMVVGGLVLLGLALAGYTMVRAAMRPLSDIERTAAAIAGGDLSRRIADEDPSTEVGRLGRALNVMLGRIEGAFREREASEARARQSEDRMRQFVADASHELRTPLTSIRGFAELHRQGAVTDPAEVGGLLERIEGEATRMGLLVEDLLLLARLDQARPLRKDPVDLLDVVTDAAHDARVLAPDRQVDLDVRGDQAPVVLGDDARLRQVVTNLVSNALTHTPAGTPVAVTLETAGSEDPESSGRVRIGVHDQGPGLTPEERERVFERFYRADPSRTRAAGGSGLGLSIVTAIVERHGGAISVSSRPGRTVFEMVLPRGEVRR
jgi:two-component system, OmpR family, sensor kinase